ncbi:AbiH family protein [Halpernia sp. GG3]
MNRLILVGNGFDLAHGLKTSYHDFIDDFWRKQMEEVQSYNNLSATFENDFIKIDNIYLITPLNNIQKHVDFKNFIQNVNDRNRNFQVSFIIKNKFLKDISDQRGLQNWVDIENEYYKQLYKIKNPINSIGRFEKYEINDLNEDFIEVKSLLVKYLKEIDKTIKVEEKICQSIYKNFSLNDFSSESIADKVNNELVQRSSNLKALEENEVDLNEIFENDEIEEKVIHSRLSSSKNKFENLKDLIIEKENSFSYAEVFNLIPAKITLLNFNYTDTPIKYFEFRYNWNNGTDKLPTFNFIHGKLNDENNPDYFWFW